MALPRALRLLVIGTCALAAALALVGCIEDSLLRCGDQLCPANAVCVAGTCTRLDQVEACSGRDPGALCTLAGVGDGVCRNGACIVPRCGDGYLDVIVGEACDDGNADDGDGCARDCRSNETCGNGLRDPGEQCDDGNAVDGDGCQHTCLLPICGDGIVDVAYNEECDDGANNANTSDHCRTTCRAPYCGDQIRDVQRGEACDDANLTAGDGCTPDCSSDESCGNGILDPFTTEICDDHNRRNHDGCSLNCEPETPTWTQLTTPSSSIGRTATYDRARQRVVAFGGGITNYVFEQVGAGWVPVGPGVSANYDTMTYDSDRKVSIALTSTSTAEWDGKNWTTPSTQERPPAQMPIAYDPLRKVVVGLAPNSIEPTVCVMWTYDGTEWTHSFTGVLPSSRLAYGITWDPSTGTIVVFGGYDVSNSALLDDTWDWNGTEWTERTTTTKPSARMNAGLAYDESRNVLVLYGSSATSDTWQWSGNGWTEVLGAGAPTASGTRFQLLYDTARQRVAVVSDPTLSMWTFDGTTWSQLPLNQTPTRRATPLVYQNHRDRFLAFGGVSGPSLNETWEFDSVGWIKYLPTTSPPPRFWHGLAYDLTRDRAVVFGGYSQSTTPTLSDTWEWDGSTWVDRTPSVSPSPRYDTQLAYDPISQRTILFSGAGPTYGSQLPADTWSWDGTTWTLLTPAHVPSARHGKPFFYDPTRGALVLLGDDSWLWSGTDWVALDTIPVPDGLVTPTENGPIVLAGSYQTDYLDTLYRWRAGAWESQPIGAPKPYYRVQTNAVYDPVRSRVMIFGGYTNNHNYLTDVWTFRFAAETPDQACEVAIDTNDDGLYGCMDTDCWGICTPLCAPGGEATYACSSTMPLAPYCGDGQCDSWETVIACPTDCP